MSSSVTEVVGQNADELVGFNVHELLYRRRTQQKELAFALDIDPSVLSKKLRGESSWSARQIVVAARFLGVEPGRLFQPSFPNIRTKLRAIPGLGRDPQPRTPLLTGI